MFNFCTLLYGVTILYIHKIKSFEIKIDDFIYKINSQIFVKIN